MYVGTFTNWWCQPCCMPAIQNVLGYGQHHSEPKSNKFACMAPTIVCMHGAASLCLNVCMVQRASMYGDAAV